MQEAGKLLVILGLVIAGMGALLWTGRFPTWLGRLPGDIVYEGKNFSFSFPIVTCLLISFLLSLLSWFLRK